MTYSDKVNKSKDLWELIESLEDGDDLIVEYSKHPKEDPKQYKIKAYRSDYNNNKSYSIWNSFRGMNIEKIGKTTMKTYDYNMMSQRTTYTFPLYEMNIIK